MKISVLAGLVVGGLLVAIMFIAVGLPTTDALLIAAILAVFVLLVGMGFQIAATAYLGVTEAFFSALAVFGTALVAILSIFG